MGVRKFQLWKRTREPAAARRGGDCGGGGRTERATGRRERSAPEPTQLEPRVSARAEGTRGAGETRDTVGCWERTGVSRCDRVRTGGGLQEVSVRN